MSDAIALSLLAAAGVLTAWRIVHTERILRRCERERRDIEALRIKRYLRARWGEGGAPQVEHADSTDGPWLSVPPSVVAVWRTEDGAGICVPGRCRLDYENGDPQA